jgi:hypothetical protein
MFFAPSLLNDIFFYKLWTSQSIKSKVTTVDKTIKIQSIAFYYSLKDTIFNSQMGWVPTGNKLTNKDLSTNRLKLGLKLMFIFDIIIMTVIILGSILRIYDGYPYYNYIYVIIQSVYKFSLSFHIILYFLNL